MNRKIFFTLCLSVMMSVAMAQSSDSPAIPRDEQIERNIDQWIGKLSLKEKVGQMCQLNISTIQKNVDPFKGRQLKDLTTREIRNYVKKYRLTREFKVGSRRPSASTIEKISNRIWDIEKAKGFQIDEALLDSVITRYRVGSILNVPDGSACSVSKWQEVIAHIQKKSMKVLGIPCLYGVDQIHGATYTQKATFFPQNINVAATFNREISREGSRISAYETKACAIPWTFAPVLDLGRDARWPRMWENFGEDPYVNAEMGAASVQGFQGGDPNNIGHDHVAACLKHYMGYGVPVSGKDRTPSSITPQDMREKHFAPFLNCIRSGALSVMVNSSSNNGLPFHANYELLTEWLKNDLKWDGLIVTDWADIMNLYNRDHIAGSKKEAIKLAINAGIDMSMDPYSWDFCTLLEELVNEGEVPMSRIDDAVRRVLRMKYRLGLFDHPYYEAKEFPDFASAQHQKAALNAAEESIVLLKNTDNILPLKKNSRILLAGPNANSMRTLNGGWSYTWQGSNAEHLAVGYNTILEAFQNKFGKDNVVYEPGVTYNMKGNWWEENKPEIEKAVAAADGVDCIVACIGENSYCETPGNLTDLNLSENQHRLVEALANTGKPVILILNEGRPRILNGLDQLCKAIVHAILPGNYGGDALANLMAGDVNFSGKMPYTYPKDINSLITYDYKPCENIGKPMDGAYDYNAVVNVLWPFGFGLSYTTFEYSNLKADKTEFTADDVINFTVDVKNTGKYAGKESVLLFSSDLVASLTPDNRRLRAFFKVDLKPGEKKTVSLRVNGKDLAFVGYDRHWILEKGGFNIQVGNQSMHVSCTETHRWDTPNK